MCSTVWFSRPQGHRGEGTRFMLTAAWLVSLLCAEWSLSRTNRSSWLWMWQPSFSALGLMVVLIKVFFSENMRQGSGCSLFRHMFKCQMWHLMWYLLFDVCVCTFCLMFVCAHFVWCLCVHVCFVDWLDEWFICERSFEMWICLWQSLSWDVPVQFTGC